MMVRFGMFGVAAIDGCSKNWRLGALSWNSLSVPSRILTLVS